MAGRINADLHCYVVIGMDSPDTLRKQGYSKGTLLKNIADACFRKGIGMLAVTSCQFDIPRGSDHDRLSVLAAQSKSLPSSYRFDKLGDNVVHIDDGERELFLLSGQAVIVIENGQRYHHNVVGTNQVPNRMCLQDTLAFCAKPDLINLAISPYCRKKFSLGRELLVKNLGGYDAIEGHVGEIRIPTILGYVPKVGKTVRPLVNLLNWRAQYLAMVHAKPWVAVSNAHWIDDIGTSSISFNRNLINDSSEKDVLASLKHVVSNGLYRNHCGYASFWNMRRTAAIFAKS